MIPSHTANLCVCSSVLESLLLYILRHVSVLFWQLVSLMPRLSEVYFLSKALEQMGSEFAYQTLTGDTYKAQKPWPFYLKMDRIGKKK